MIKEGRGGMFIVTLGSEDDRFVIMGEKKMLKGSNERIEEDMTWQERRRKWQIERWAWRGGKKQRKR